MDLKDTFRYFVGAYYGVSEMDNYELKEYVLKDIEEYIKEFIKDNPIKDFDYRRELQDSLIVLPKVNASMELILLVKAKIKELREEEIS